MIDLDLYRKFYILNPDFKNAVKEYIDFLLSKQNDQGRILKPQFGSAKGRFKMAADFDEPLDDLKDYM